MPILARELPGGVQNARARGDRSPDSKHEVWRASDHADRLAHRNSEEPARNDAGQPGELVLADNQRSDKRDDEGGCGCECSAHDAAKVVFRFMAQPPVPSSSGDDWATQGADTVERLVGGIRGKTTVPLTTAARALVFGQVAAVIGLAGGVLLAVILVRLGDSYLPIHPHARAAWITEAIIGGTFTLIGALLLRKASATRATKKK